MSVADKLLPSFYVIEVQGAAMQSIIPGDFGIEKISIGSRDFTNDMYAFAALSDAMQFIILNPDIDQTEATEQIDYNPEFFPLMKSAELSPEKKEKQAAQEKEAEEITRQTNEPSIALTREFDQLGDFVETRWTVKSPSFNVMGRVAVNPDRYLRQKAMDLPDRSPQAPVKTPPKQISLH